MRKLNYKRGFQRVYLALSVAWIVTVLVIAIRDRPIAAPKDIWDLAAAAPASAPAADAKSAPAHIDLDALAAKFGGRDAPATLPADFDFSKPPTAGTSHAARGYWILRTLVAFGSPLAGYVALFIVLPWIVRGFATDERQAV